MFHDDASSLSRKEREKLFKRREILSAALSVFAEKGYEQATIEEIAEKAEFSKGALYNYFSHKEEMFKAILNDSLVEFERIFESVTPGGSSVREQFRRMTVATLEYFNENPDYLTILINENLHVKIRMLPEFREDYALRREKMVKAAAKLFEKAIQEGKIRSIDTIQLVEVFWNIIFTFMLNYRLNGRKTPVDEITETVLTIFFDGVELK